MGSTKALITILGAGYVGLPLAVAFAEAGLEVRVYDISSARIEELRLNVDRTNSIDEDTIRRLQNFGRLRFSTSLLTEENRQNIFIVTVPTDIDAQLKPDLRALRSASRDIGDNIKDGDIVIYESTVFPGVTEEVCKPILESFGCQKFGLGYSPERINPGDTKHSLQNVVKIVAASDEETLDVICELYGHIVKAGLYRAPSIKIAEAAKALENTQRDLNIALMNEMALICHRLHIDTQEVIKAASTKWNFLPFKPGLVGGHCIAVDPYYLATCAEEVGIHPQVILSGRRINSGMGAYIAQQTVKEMLKLGLRGPVGVLGVTFKEDVPDIRNSRVPDLVCELKSYGLDVDVWDPLANSKDVEREYGFELAEGYVDIKHEKYGKYEVPDTLIVAVAHQGIQEIVQEVVSMNEIELVIDVKGILPPLEGVRVWRL